MSVNNPSTAGGGAPSGAAGGDLGGTYPNPTVPGLSLATANTQTASYTLALTDAGKVVEENSASATVITIPTNATVAFPVGTVIELARIGAGTVTITPAGGVTIPNRLEAAGTTSRTLTSQYSSASIRQRATNVWVLTGDFS